MFSALTGSCSRLSAIASALVALGVAGCSADLTRFDNGPFSRAAQSDQPAGGLLPASFVEAFSGLDAPLVVRPKADLLTGRGPAEQAGRDNSAARFATPDKPIRMSRRQSRPGAASAKGSANAVKKVAKLGRASLTVHSRRGRARPAQNTAGMSVDTPVADAAAIFHWPVRGKILARFGRQPDGQENSGIDIAAAEGTPIKAAEDGVVIYAGNGLKSLGNLALVRHANNYVTAYAHAKELEVERGDQVKRGDIIGRSGQTGNVGTSRVHFEIRKDSVPVDPVPLLKSSSEVM
jgi:murein DD-endopeptidase MepM/ murein hydrolase activator NlpD